MIYFNQEKEQFEFYRIKSTFRHNSKNRVIFDNSKKSILSFVDKHSDINDLRIESIRPTEDQKERLEKLNEKKDVSKVRHSDALNFVENGIVHPEGSLQTFYNDYKEDTLTFIKDLLKKKLREVRKEKESEGTEFTYEDESYFVRTDAETQAKIASTEKALENNSEISYIDWERSPEEWSEVNLDMLNAMGQAVFEHVQSVFSECKKQIDRVNDCSEFDDFKSLDISWVDPKEVHPLSDWIRDEE